MITTESTAGVSEKIVSVATASDSWVMLKAGNLDLKCFLIGNHVEVTPHQVINLKVFPIIENDAK